jgi:hypothetical protein
MMCDREAGYIDLREARKPVSIGTHLALRRARGSHWDLSRGRSAHDWGGDISGSATEAPPALPAF